MQPARALQRRQSGGDQRQLGSPLEPAKDEFSTAEEYEQKLFSQLSGELSTVPAFDDTCASLTSAITHSVRRRLCLDRHGSDD